MKRQFRLLILTLALLGCTAETRRTVPQSDSQPSIESQQLRQMLEDYFDEFLRLAPLFATSIGDYRYNDQLAIVISEEQRGRRRALYRNYQSKIATIPRARLEANDQLILAVFERTLTRNLEALQFNQHLQPVRQLNSMAVDFPVIGSGTGLHPFKSVTDYDNFLKRIDRFPVWVDTAIANMRKGMEVGVVQPKVVIERTLPQLDAMIVAEPKQSLFFQPIQQMPQNFSDSDRARLTAAYSQGIEQRIVPAYRKLRDFVQEEYLPKTRATYGFSDLPDGSAWYEHAVRTQTSTTLTPEEIFQLGTGRNLPDQARDGAHARRKRLSRQSAGVFPLSRQECASRRHQPGRAHQRIRGNPAESHAAADQTVWPTSASDI